MCVDNGGNKVEVCKVGDLKPGQRFRDPDGNEFLIADGFLIVNVATGAVVSTLDWVGNGYRKDVRLGTDRQGRLYASRFLNPPTPTAVIGS